MNRRERILAGLVGAVAFLLVNIFIWSSLLGAISSTRAELVKRKSVRTSEAVYVKERTTWVKRDEWLRKHQPQLKGPGDASTLLDQVKQVAGKHEVLIENPAIGTGDATPNHQSVFASIETKSPWPPLVHFFYDVQQPESFIVFENATLAIDSADPTMMRGKFKIARWFAPGAGGARK
ncbi:MAG: hypothetical protein ACJ8I9_07500 [Chthoniobacterales bacterium]